MWEEPVHVAWRHYQDWVLPLRVVRIILTVALAFVFVGMILVTVGGAVDNSRLVFGGGVLAGVGGCGLLLCLLLCLHAFFVFRVRDQAVQTEDGFWKEEEDNVAHPVPNSIITATATSANVGAHAHTLPLPSALKSTDSSLRRPTKGEPKKTVSYSGEVQCYSPYTTPSPTLSSASMLSSVFSSTAGTLSDRGKSGANPAGGWVVERGEASRGSTTHHLPSFPVNDQSQSLPRNLHLQQLIEDNDYDVPVDRAERAPMLAAPTNRRPPLSRPPEPEIHGGSVKRAEAEVSMPMASMHLSRPRTFEKTSDYDNI